MIKPQVKLSSQLYHSDLLKIVNPINIHSTGITPIYEPRIRKK
ncbi:hypothetical protein MTBBW1_1110022 [Desulfamplus magnetovallimortis]|uniref:Uncharacterized protein n=1 Tax=Desulfamplus magnetovallimortis TaxID=1246637 RepID=A0A1W1H5J7_9BACT|nr:hypothetical protein MTBBW1_1110022 [Desulfamplus magnetovallimortis]